MLFSFSVNRRDFHSFVPSPGLTGPSDPEGCSPQPRLPREPEPPEPWVGRDPSEPGGKAHSLCHLQGPSSNSTLGKQRPVNPLQIQTKRLGGLGPTALALLVCQECPPGPALGSPSGHPHSVLWEAGLSGTSYEWDHTGSVPPGLSYLTQHHILQVLPR